MFEAIPQPRQGAVTTKEDDSQLEIKLAALHPYQLQLIALIIELSELDLARLSKIAINQALDHVTHWLWQFADSHRHYRN